MRGPSPLAKKVTKSLRSDLASGVIPAGGALPTERELADRHGVSRTVVREAVAILAREGLLLLQDRCRPVVAEHVGRPARHTGPRQVAIWLWPYADDYIASSIIRGIQRVARSSHARLVMATAAHGTWDEVLESEDRFLRGLAADDQIDGAILWYLGAERNVPALMEAQRHGVRLVFVDRKPPEGIDADFVGTENVTAARGAVAHLLELGHRRIAFVGNMDPVSSVAEREEGYRRAFEDAGRLPDPDLRFLYDAAEGELEKVAARRTAEAILKLSPRPTAVFSVNDLIGFSLYEAFRDLGVRVPEEFSVVGFDGLLRWVPGGGHITTAVQNFPRIGELAADILFRGIRTPGVTTYRHVLLDAPLSLRDSTAPPPVG